MKSDRNSSRKLTKTSSTDLRSFAEPISPQTAWAPSPSASFHERRTRIVRKDLPTYKELTKCVPRECFVRHLPTSLAYIVWDVALIALMYRLEPAFEYFGWIGLIIWYFTIGIFGLALFVIGHDCGHGSFSDYTWVNDLVGHIVHSPILTPYWPWQKSHRIHHTFTNHLTKDHGHVWITEKVWRRWAWYNKVYANFPGTALIKYPFYLFAGISDGVHFWPWSSLFDNSNTLERIKCVFSTACCALCAYIAFTMCDYNLHTYFKFYILPIFAYGFWLTLTTFLQHLRQDVKVYEEGTWQFVQAQLETIDRPYGFYIDEAIHHITDGHLAHHLFFTKIPHYNLVKATEALRAKLEPLGLYQHRVSYDFFLEYARLNFNLRYLLGEGSGLLNYAPSGHVLEDELSTARLQVSEIKIASE